MPGDLQMEPTAARSVANKILEEKNSFSTLLGNIDSLNGELQGYWAGQDAIKYTNAIRTQSETMHKLAETIQSTGDSIIAAANMIEKSEAEHAAAIHNH